MYCVPSTLQTQASRTSSLRSRRAHAPSGTWQPPSSVLRRVRSVPEGFVTTFGDVSPGSPRFAGAVLAHTDADVPWQRVVRADGSLAKGAD